jgi:multidrug resistance efflux pump
MGSDVTKAAARQRAILRVSSVSVAGVLSLLMVTAVLPPLVADQSDRAVINAPVALLTAPVAGDIEEVSVRAGLDVHKGQSVARISNPRVDRSTLITLEGKAAETRERALAAERKHASNVEYLAALDRSIKDQSARIATIFDQQIAELRSRVAASVSSGQEKKSVIERQSTMVARNVASPEMLKPAEQQYAAALHDRDAASARLNQKLSQADALRSGVYVGEDLAGLATLSQKRRDISFDAQRLAIEKAELDASLRDQQKLLQAERDRLASLESATVEAPVGGKILQVGAAAGRHVSAGDALASVVDCNRAAVVAIFSYRQAQNMSVGTRVEISGAGDTGPLFGTVSEILPKASDKMDELYAVPFPQTERRELYVLVRPERSDRQSYTGVACDVGKWVTVTRANGWVPSVSVVWRSISQHFAQAFSAPLFTSANADVVHPELRTAETAR